MVRQRTSSGPASGTSPAVARKSWGSSAPSGRSTSRICPSGPTAGPEAPDRQWQKLWDVHVMAHVWAARALVPGMGERGEGYLLSTASAAGLLMSPGAVPYTVTKHAALSLAENLLVLYGDAGIRVCACAPSSWRPA